MFVEHDFYIGFDDLMNGNKVSNKGILRYLEDIAGIHSNMVGHGLNDTPKINHSWILLGWKVKLYKRPIYGESIKVITWSKVIHKFYALRDFKIFSDSGELLGIATSKWVYINIEKESIVKVSEDVIKIYDSEDISVFEENSFGKLKEPEKFDNKCSFLINRSMIDMNNHVHNLYYLDIANEALPENVYNDKEFNEFEIMYKKEIKSGDNVKCLYSNNNKEHIVTIKSQDEKIIHAIINLKEI